MTWDTAPLWSVSIAAGRKVAPLDLPDAMVYHYAIDELGVTGRPRRQEPSEISSDKLVVEPEDILISRLNPRKGHVFTVGSHDHRSIASTEFAVVRTRPGVDRRFVVYVLRSDDTRSALDARVRSATKSHGRVEFDAIWSLSVPVPPLEVQRRFADYLDTETARIDTLIAANKRAARLVEERLASARERIVDGPRVALNYALRSLKQGSSPVADAYSSAGSGQEGVLKLSAIRRGRFASSENKLLINGSDGLLRVRAGQILISRANTPELVGDVAHVADKLDAELYAPDLMFVLTTDERVADPGFVTEALLTSESRAQMSGVARGSSQSMVKLRQDDVRALRICLPARDVQDRKVGRIRELRRETTRLLDRMRLQHELLRERRMALITAAVTGELEV